MPSGFQWETFPEFLNYIESLPHAIDFGSNLAYSCVRAYVLGLENAGGAASPAQVVEMKALVAEAMAAGAMGICASRSAVRAARGWSTVPQRFPS